MIDDDLYGLGESVPDPGAGLIGRPTNPGYSNMPSGMPAALPQSGGGNAIGTIMKTVLPALAAIYAMKKGSGLGSFTQGMQGQQVMQMRQDEHAAEQEFRQAQIERQQMMDQRAAEEDQLRMQAQEEAQRRQHEQQMRTVLSGALSQAAENPAFMEMVNETGPEKYSINVPGLGNVNLKSAFDQIGVVQGPGGKFNYGRPPAPPPVPKQEEVREYTYEDDDGNTVAEVMTPTERGKRGVLVKNKYKAPKPEKEPAQRTQTSEEFSGGKVWSVTIDPITGKELNRRVKRKMTEREMQEQGEEAPTDAPAAGKDPLGIR